jgi:bifunctional DNA-binding transcriptional regulator/antitoxin component of YhaV-PrlF toxin-antitoxin module
MASTAKNAFSPTHRVGSGGTVRLPPELLCRFGITEGSEVVTEAREEGILIRPAGTHAVEIYTPERKAEFLLGCATDAEEYARAVAEVRAMGLDPEQIDHFKPRGV